VKAQVVIQQGEHEDPTIIDVDLTEGMEPVTMVFTSTGVRVLTKDFPRTGFSVESEEE
jgi:hypothetical protein